jgi:hypothetical protein
MKCIALGVELWSADVRPMLLATSRFAKEIGARWMAISVSDATHALPRLAAGERQRMQQNRARNIPLMFIGAHHALNWR